MAVTLNASNSGTGGLSVTSDATGNLAFQTAGTTAVTVDTSQNATFAGTASATKLIPTGSSATGTGMYLPAANSLGLSTNGTNAVYIDSSQNVGIGTSSPTSKLNIVDASANSLRISGAGDHALGFTGYSGNAATQVFSIRNDGINNCYINTQNSTPLSFGVSTGTSFGSTTEHMRINSSGYVGIGTTSPTVKLFVAASDTGPRIAVDQTADNAADMITFRRNGSERGKIYISDSATVYQTSSDYRLKKNITPLTGSLETVAKLKPSSFTWVQERGGQQDTGFIAHELAEVMPQAVTGEKDATREEEYEVTPAVKDEQGNITTLAVMGTRTVPVYQGIDTSFLVATLTAAIQELKAINDTQAATITALTARIVALEK